MRKTSYIFNKIDFIDEAIKKYQINANEIKIKKYKQFIHIFSSMKDFRIKAKCKYSIETLLLIIFFAKLAGEGDNCMAIARYAKYEANSLYELGLIYKDNEGEYVLPTHDCFRYFLLNFDSNEIKKALINRIKTFLDNIAELKKDGKDLPTLLNVDGQEFRGTGREKNTLNPSGNLATLNIFDASCFVCLYSIPISKKDSEITKSKEILTYLNLTDKIITADALHTQIDTVKLIASKHGHYVLAVKDNQKLLKQDIINKFDNESNSVKTVETDERSFYFYKLPKDYIGLEFEAQRTYIKTISKAKKTKGEIMYFISSLDKDEVIKEAIENRWEIENGLHKSKDCYLDEDIFRIKDKTAVENVAVINNVIVSFYKIAKTVLDIKTMIDVKTMFKHDPVGSMQYMVSLISSNSLKKMIEEHMEADN